MQARKTPAARSLAKQVLKANDGTCAEFGSVDGGTEGSDDTEGSDAEDEEEDAADAPANSSKGKSAASAAARAPAITQAVRNDDVKVRLPVLIHAVGHQRSMHMCTCAAV